MSKQNNDLYVPSRNRRRAISADAGRILQTRRTGLNGAGGLTRRRLLQVGGISAIGLGLPELLQADFAGTAAQSEKSCIFIVQYGGPSHIDTFDPKPRTPDEIRGPYQPIDTRVPGMQIGELLPQLARLSDRYCLIRSMSHRNSDHDGGTHVCMTGHSNPKSSTPYFGSIVSKLRPTTHNMPSYVWVQDLDRDVKPWYLTGGFLGAAHAPLLVGKRQDNAAKQDFRVTAFDPPQGVTTERLLKKYELLERLEPRDRPLRQAKATDDFGRFQDRALELVTGPEARRAFDLNQEPQTVRDSYGPGPFGQNLLMARRLVESGVRLVTVNAWCGVAPDHKFLVTQGWDHHGAAVQKCGIFSNGSFGLGFVLPRFDQAVAALLEDLEQRGLLESTLVVAVGEFGRTPKITKSPYPGRDHWPQCYSALLAGGGIRGGTVYGSSDKQGAYVKDRPVSPETFGATLFQALGIPPETRFGPDGFSFQVSEGRPIESLFG